MGTRHLTLHEGVMNRQVGGGRASSKLAPNDCSLRSTNLLFWGLAVDCSSSMEPKKSAAGLFAPPLLVDPDGADEVDVAELVEGAAAGGGEVARAV